MPRPTIAQLTKQLETIQTKLQETEQALEHTMRRLKSANADVETERNQVGCLEEDNRVLRVRLDTEQRALRAVLQLAEISKTSVAASASQAERQGRTIEVLNGVIMRIMDLHEDGTI